MLIEHQLLCIFLQILELNNKFKLYIINYLIFNFKFSQFYSYLLEKYF